jgi:hypothetical protein
MRVLLAGVQANVEMMILVDNGGLRATEIPD